jgi:hypothetical protein
MTYLRKSAIVPDVAVVREAVAHKTEPAFLDILLDGIEGLFLGDFHLSIGPSGDFDDHVENAMLLISMERNVMERRDDGSMLLDENAVLCGVIDRCLKFYETDR